MSLFSTFRERDHMKEDVWIPSACGLCQGICGILVHRIDGVVTKIEGNPDCPNSQGRLCPKGLSGLMLLYDPNRVNVPLKRTNPEKGIGIDPKWVEISWEEALDTITQKLAKIRQEDPRKLLLCYSVVGRDQSRMAGMFGAAFGSPNSFTSGAGNHCGNAEHFFGGLLHAAWAKQPDFDYCEYLLNFGVPAGCGAYYCPNGMAQQLSDARARGMKHVVIDPMLNTVGEKADEWLSIRPGTDGALALAMLNILLNELQIYDAGYLKHHTNAPYLIGEDGLYMRDKESQKPLIWDSIEKKASTYDDASIRDFALLGEFSVEGLTCHTAFSLLREHVKKYTPELAAGITGISAETIYRITREFGEAARIGSTIVLNGKELPFRPVSVLYFRGAQGHKNATLTSMAIELLLEVVGASNVPGGTLGMSSRSLGYPGSGKPCYSPAEGPDGLMKTGTWQVSRWPYPPGEARKPLSYGLGELVPTCVTGGSPAPLAMLEPEKFKIPYRIELCLSAGNNFMMTLADPKAIARAFRDVFMVKFSLYLDETAEMADIVLPDACYLERYSCQTENMHSTTAKGDWCYFMRQPIVKPLYQRRDSQEVFLELASRLGMEKDLFRVMKASSGPAQPYTLDTRDSYKNLEEIIDGRNKSLFGEEHGLEWFKTHGLLKWPKKVEEVYWKNFVKARVPVYFEFLKKVGSQVKKIAGENGIEGIDTSAFQALPDWNPCPSHQEKRSEYDLFAIYFRVPFHTFSSTYNNPWLDEASRIDPYGYNIVVNARTAAEKGIKDGDWIVLESSATEGRVEGRARLTEAINPEVVAMANCGGHWAKGLPLASQRGKGACHEWLLPLSLDYMDIPVFNQDLCVKVKVYKEGV